MPCTTRCQPVRAAGNSASVLVSLPPSPSPSLSLSRCQPVRASGNSASVLVSLAASLCTLHACAAVADVCCGMRDVCCVPRCTLHACAAIATYAVRASSPSVTYASLTVSVCTLHACAAIARLLAACVTYAVACVTYAVCASSPFLCTLHACAAIADVCCGMRLGNDQQQPTNDPHTCGDSCGIRDVCRDS